MYESDPLAPVLHGSYGDFDCTGIVNRYSMQCEIVERDGGNGGLLRDGRQVRDILARKVRLSWTLNSIPASEYAALKTALATMEYARVFDPSAGGVRRIECAAEFPAFELAFVDGEEPMSKAGAALVLEEV